MKTENDSNSRPDSNQASLEGRYPPLPPRGRVPQNPLGSRRRWEFLKMLYIFFVPYFWVPLVPPPGASRPWLGRCRPPPGLKKEAGIQPPSLCPPPDAERKAPDGEISEYKVADQGVTRGREANASGSTITPPPN